MTASIGIALGGEPAATVREQPEHLLRDAHTAMYRAKALGTGRYQVFNASMHAVAVERLQLETDLRMASSVGSLCCTTSRLYLWQAGRLLGLRLWYAGYTRYGV